MKFEEEKHWNYFFLHLAKVINRLFSTLTKLKLVKNLLSFQMRKFRKIFHNTFY